METIFWCINQAGSIPPSLNNSSPSNILHMDELSRWKAMKIPKRQAEWFLGRLTAKLLLTSAPFPLHNTALSSIKIANHPEGAPYIETPKSPGSISISHRADFAVAAYTPSTGCHVGIDLEKIEPRSWSFIEDFFTSKEALYARSLSQAATDIWTTLAWSAKEAILKVWQKGLRLDTRSVEIIPANVSQPTTFSWQPLTWQAHLDGFPDCWLWWMRFEDYILTLAGTKKMSGSIKEPPKIQQISLA